MVPDFIYDEHGTAIARILGRKVFSEFTGKEIARLQDGAIYDLKGEFLGYLKGLHMIGPDGSSSPESFRRLLR